MQIKKSPRDADYTGIPRFENGYTSEPSDDVSEPARPDAFSVRPARPVGAAIQTQKEGEGRAPSAARSQSVIDRHSSFDGHFETEHDLRVEGTISGEVVCRGLLTVEREATARARIQAHDAHIQGRVEGDLVCTGKLLLSATAQVTGTLKAAVLVVEEGASVSGTVDTTQSQIPARPAVAVENGNGSPREAATVTRPPRRDLPSFAIVSSEERAAPDRN